MATKLGKQFHADIMIYQNIARKDNRDLLVTCKQTFEATFEAFSSRKQRIICPLVRRFWQLIDIQLQKIKLLIFKVQIS